MFRRSHIAAQVANWIRGRKWGTANRFSLAEPHRFQHECDARIGGCPLFSRCRTCTTGCWCGHERSSRSCRTKVSLPSVRRFMRERSLTWDGSFRSVRAGSNRAMGRPLRVMTSSPSFARISSKCGISLRTSRIDNDFNWLSVASQLCSVCHFFRREQQPVMQLVIDVASGPIPACGRSPLKRADKD